MSGGPFAGAEVGDVLGTAQVSSVSNSAIELIAEQQAYLETFTVSLLHLLRATFCAEDRS